MRNEALQRGNESANLLRSILDRSREICLSLYEKELFTEESYRDLYDKCVPFPVPCFSSPVLRWSFMMLNNVSIF